MEKVYLVIEKEDRGEVVDIVELKSNLDVEDFCKSLLDYRIKELRGKGVEWEYIEEFCSIGNYGNLWEVSWSEGMGYDVYELKS